MDPAPATSSPEPTSANLTRAETRARAAVVDPVDVDVALDLSAAADPEVATFRSITTVRFHSSVDSTWLDLLAPRVLEVTVNGRPLDPATSHDGARIHLHDLDTSAGAVNEVVVTADCAYRTTGEGLHRTTDPVDGATYLYTQFEPTDARRVFACFEQPDCKSPFTFHVTAPDGWHVRSNTIGTPSEDPTAPDTTTWHFAPTRSISSYLTVVLAGPWHVVSDTWTRPADDRHDALEVPMALLCRASLADHLEVDEVFELTRAGLDFFHDVFDVAYPFGRYDQAFVPEYNAGAMEHPGLVTFNDRYVFRSAVTDAERERRATTILHEMAHMWFGDLVTMQWWDDLWLKESFADYMATLATAEATRFGDAWTTFATSDKARAYRADQLPTTHPIVADIVDLEAAALNFDGITYSKGASVLRQLVAWVGRDAFLAGANDYFVRHAWSNTTLDDFLDVLEATSGRDLQAWSQAWLQTAGPSELRVEVEQGAGLQVQSARLVADSVDPATSASVARPHRVAVGGYEVVDGRLEQTARSEVDVADTAVDIPALVDRQRPAMVLPNHDDLTYAKVVLDDPSVEAARSHLSTIPDSLARAVAWAALWDAARDARLPTSTFLAIADDHGPAEDHAGSLMILHRQVRHAIAHHLPAPDRPAWRGRLHATAVATAVSADPGGDGQLAWLRLAIALGGDRTDWLAGLLDDRGVPPGLTMDAELRWSAMIALAAAGAIDVDDLDAELARDDRAQTRRRRATALAARPTAAAKDRAWRDVVDRDDLPNTTVDAILAGWGRADQRDLTARFEAPYLDLLEPAWGNRSLHMARRLVVGLFPPGRDLVAGKRAPEQHPTVVAVDDWLDTHADAPGALRRLVVEQRDDLARSLRVQAAGSTEAIAG